MTWNWQQPDWPNFTWNRARLEKAEQQFLLCGGVLVGTVKHLPEDDGQQLTVEAMSTEAIATSEIEGEILDRASVQSSIRKQLGLSVEERKVRPAEQGIAEMTVDLYRSFSEPLSQEMLFRWHKMIVSGRRDLKQVGGFRTGTEPMQIVSGRVPEPRVHFEAPPSSQVPSEMGGFFHWFTQTNAGAERPLPALTRAAVAHLYFESIHPFEDGNGRIGRAISEKSLAESLGEPTLIALAGTILLRRKNYYEALEEANKRNEITNWITWFAAIVIEAQRRTTALAEFLIDKTKLLDRLKGELNERQTKALMRMFREGPEGFQAGLSAGKYSTITGASPATTTRDLSDLVSKGAFMRKGELRHARYRLNIALRPVGHVLINEQGDVTEA
ncbi:MAG: Fic family protein [Candidatus Acidiferrales bacterium]